jgi:hypothetical protein
MRRYISVGLVLVAATCGAPRAFASASLTIGQAQQGAPKVDKRADLTVIQNGGFKGYPGSWAVTSIRLRNCDRLSRSIVECPVVSDFAYRVTPLLTPENPTSSTGARHARTRNPVNPHRAPRRRHLPLKNR